MRRFLWLAALPLSLAACDIDNRPGTFQFVGSNDANLRAMIADPDDLVTGVVDRRADGQVVAAAVARYRAGKIKDIPDATISKVAPISINTGGGSSSAAGSQ